MSFEPEFLVTIKYIKNGRSWKAALKFQKTASPITGLPGDYRVLPGDYRLLPGIFRTVFRITFYQLFVKISET